MGSTKLSAANLSSLLFLVSKCSKNLSLFSTLSKLCLNSATLMPLGNGVALASKFLFKSLKKASLSSMTSKGRVSCSLMLLTRLFGFVASFNSSLACLTPLLSSSMILSVLLVN